MFNIGMTELIVILLVAFLVVGPKDLPKVARYLARGVKKLRSLIRDLKAQAHWDEVISEVKDVQEGVDRAVREADAALHVREAVQQVKDAADISGVRDGMKAAGEELERALGKADKAAPGEM